MQANAAVDGLDPRSPDLTALAWLRDELNRSVEAAIAALKRACAAARPAPGDGKPDLQALQAARGHLHQALGALEMAGLLAPAQLLRAMESAAQTFMERPAQCTPVAVAQVEQAGFALCEHLEGLLAGRLLSPVTLFPPYRATQALSGPDSAHPADLWPFSWGWQPLPPGWPASPLTADPALRARLDAAVLGLVKAGDDGCARELTDLCAGLAASAQSPPAASFWSLAAAFFEARALRLLADDLYVKRAISGVLVQYTRLAKSAAEVPKRQTRDLLFFCAQSCPPDPAAAPFLAAVRQAWGLAGHIRLAYDEPSFSQFDPALLAQARKVLAGVRDSWAALAGGDSARCRATGEQLNLLCEVLARLYRPFTPLTRVLHRVASDLLSLETVPRAELSLETATAILFLDAVLDGFHPADPQLAPRAQQLAQRLDQAQRGTPCDPLETWMEDLYRGLSDRQTLESVVGELRIALADLEKALDGFVRQPQARDTLQDVPSQLVRLRGVLSVLGLEPAAQATARMREMIQGLLLTSDELPAADLQTLGNNLGALGFMVDMLAYQPALVPGLFVFDEIQGELRPVMGRTQIAPAPAPALVPQSPPAVPHLGAAIAAPADEGYEDHELKAVFLDEAYEAILAGRLSLDALAAAPADLSALAVLRRVFHTLKGSARMVDLPDFGEAAWVVEEVLNGWLASQQPATPDLRELACQALDHLAHWRDDIAAGRQPIASAATFTELVQSLTPSIQGGDPLALAEPPAAVDPEAIPEPQEEPASRLGGVVAPLMETFLAEADDWSLRLQAGVCAWAHDPGQPVPAAVSGLAHAMAGSAATVGLHSLADLARRLESSMVQTQSTGRATTQHAQAYTEAAEDIRRLLHQLAAGFLDAPAWYAGQALKELGLQTAAQGPSDEAGGPNFPATHLFDGLGSGLVLDEDCADLLPFFLDEANELVPQLGGTLRKWQTRPQDGGSRDQVLRTLHTLKGSARLAGALHAGSMAHALESMIEALPDLTSVEALEPLLPAFDALRAEIDALRPGGLREIDEPPTPQTPAPQAFMTRKASPASWVPLGLITTDAAAAPAPSKANTLAPLRPAANAVRVRADLLDRLMDGTGQVMVTRLRLEAELKQLRGSLGDLTGNLERLRSQLRDIELQAESQMQSRLAQAKGSAVGFDPLEFDRFTRVQELTRMMAESVNDVATVQRTLQRTVEASEDELAVQARQTRELQRDLLSTRMVGFESVAERLHGVVRLAARETGKQVRLDLQGEAIEMDRGVLERMAPVFEHLLRNAVAHGIEGPAARIASGKAPAGRILVTLSQEGNDVALAFEDDGAGLDLVRIRERALALDLLKDGETLDEPQAVDLIFAPGFSTATEVTELAGRGIGMDVVRAEVNAMGGRIDVASRAGQGMRLRLVLPLTTAVTQVVMLRCGPCVFGVPAPLVESVNRTSAKDVQQAYNSSQFEMGGESLPFFWGGALLQASPRSTEPQGRALPVAVLRSASQRLALHVDEVIGHDEVVVKNLGPQLARLPGLAGMTVLPSGAPVLIYNPVALAAVHGEQARAFGRDQAQPHVLAQSRPDAPPQRPLVLVVDDSITVRRVTQRLLQREGYRVAVACDGLQALEQLAQREQDPPVVVLSDIEMPRMDGFELARTLRADPRWAELPIVMITSRSAAKHRDHAMELGVNHYLGKPYPDEELLALVRHYAAVFLTTA